MYTRWKYITFFALFVNLCIAILRNNTLKLEQFSVKMLKLHCIVLITFYSECFTNEVLSDIFLPYVKQPYKSKSYGKTNDTENWKHSISGL